MRPSQPAISAVLRAHRFVPKGARDCTCGWDGGQMWPTRHHEEHLADVLVALYGDLGPFRCEDCHVLPLIEEG